MQHLSVAALLVAVSSVCVFGQHTSLKCVTCHGASSFEECDLQGERQCLDNQDSCETVVRRHGSQIFVSKGCKQTLACRNNQMQNGRPSGKSTQCNGDQENSFCTCCCEGELCNVGADTCSAPVSISLFARGNDCPAPPTRFPHGTIDCQDGVCNYQCTSPTYDIWPAGRDQNVCGADGRWQFETPCCARACPPYFLYDSVGLYSVKNETLPLMVRTLESFIPNTDIGPESVLMATMSFGPDPMESTVVNFNDYGTNVTRLYELIYAKSKTTESEIVNTGAAIDYAVNNMLREDAGMRDRRVPKSITIYTDTNASDDVKTAAEAARNLGYLLYVFFFEREGVVIDEQQLLDIAGTEDHIFKFGTDFDDFPESWKDDIVKHFCDDPCNHVLHDE